MAQNDKKLTPYVSQTIHLIVHMIFIYGVHVKKDNISRCFSHFFQILIFVVNSGKRAKKCPKITKKYVWCTPYPRKHASYDGDFWYIYVK